MGNINWSLLDNDKLDEKQRKAVELCHALVNAGSGKDKEARLVMLDVLAVLVIYEIFGRQTDMAAATHANHIMQIADDVDLHFTGVKPRDD